MCVYERQAQDREKRKRGKAAISQSICSIMMMIMAVPIEELQTDTYHEREDPAIRLRLFYRFGQS